MLLVKDLVTALELGSVPMQEMELVEEDAVATVVVEKFRLDL